MIVPLNSVDLARDNCAFDVDANRDVGRLAKRGSQRLPLLSIEAQVQPMVATPRQPARKKHPSASRTAISTQKRLHETLETVVVNVLQAHVACRCATAARLAAPYHFL